MANPIPTLGYRSRAAAVIAMFTKGMTAKEIAHRIGISAENAETIIRNYGPDRRTNMAIQNDILLALTIHANRRGVTSRILAARILRAIVEHGLVDAVLDDGHHHHRASTQEVRSNV